MDSALPFLRCTCLVANFEMKRGAETLLILVRVVARARAAVLLK